MARLDFNFDNEFINQLGTMAQVDRYATKMIDEALPIIKNKLLGKLAPHSRTSGSGGLYSSIKAKKSKQASKGGYYGYITAVGEDSDGVRHAEKLVYLEYGNEHQDALGLIQTTIEETRDEVNNKMQEVFNREALKEG